MRLADKELDDNPKPAPFIVSEGTELAFIVEDAAVTAGRIAPPAFSGAVDSAAYGAEF